MAGSANNISLPICDDQQHQCPSSLWAFSADEDERLRTVRGMKFSAFEGGVRVASFVSGGALPASRRGKSADGLVHIADWCDQT